MVKKIIRSISIVLSILIFMIGILKLDCNLLLISVLLIFLTMIIYSYNEKENELILLAFLISFFTFLLGKYTIYFFSGVDWQKDFSNVINVHIQICLYISLMGIFIGYYITNNKRKKSFINKNKEYDIEIDDNIQPIRKASLILFFVTLIFKMIVIFNKIIFVRNHSYLALYTEYEPNLPLIIMKLSEINTFLIYIYLATLPTKRN